MNFVDPRPAPAVRRSVHTVFQRVQCFALRRRRVGFTQRVPFLRPAAARCTTVVVLAAPSTDGTSRLFDPQRLARLRPDAWLINVGRGSLVDTDALVAALDAGRLGGAALDVTDPEPLPKGHPLWGHERALITPHIGTTVDAERRHYVERVRENVERFAAGRELLGVVDRSAGY